MISRFLFYKYINKIFLAEVVVEKENVEKCKKARNSAIFESGKPVKRNDDD